MVEVEIRTPVYDEEEGQISWRRRALVRAEGHDLALYTDGDESLIPDDLAVLDLASGEQVRRTDDAERWARNLPHAYRNGDIVAVVLIDSDAPSAPVGDNEPRATLTIPAPPEPAGVPVCA